MDRATFLAAGTSSRIGVTEPNARQFPGGWCGMMSVAYLPRIAETGRLQGVDQIAILIPGEQGAFHALYRTTDGRRQTAFVRAPGLSVIPANQAYSLFCERQADMIVIGLEQAYFEAVVREASGSEPPELAERYSAVDPFMRELGNTLKREFRMRKIPSEAYLKSLAGLIAIHLAANYGMDNAARRLHTGLPPHKLKRVQAFVDAHFTEAIRVEQLAEAVHMSPYHFARMFKKATGQPPHAYITAQRIEHAKSLLTDSQLPLVDVAAAVGFETQGHFTGVFRKYAGVTPRIFRLSSRAARTQAA